MCHGESYSSVVTRVRGCSHVSLNCTILFYAALQNAKAYLCVGQQGIGSRAELAFASRGIFLAGVSSHIHQDQRTFPCRLGDVVVGKKNTGVMKLGTPAKIPQPRFPCSPVSIQLRVSLSLFSMPFGVAVTFQTSLRAQCRH